MIVLGWTVNKNWLQIIPIKPNIIGREVNGKFTGVLSFDDDKWSVECLKKIYKIDSSTLKTIRLTIRWSVNFGTHPVCKFWSKN